MTKRVVREPRSFFFEGEEYLEIRYRELCVPGQFVGFLGNFIDDNGGVDLDSLTHALAFNNRVRGNVFGSHLILEKESEFACTTIALVTIYPASVIKTCAQVKQTYGIKSVGLVSVESCGDDTDYVAYISVGLNFAMQCIQRLANSRNMPQTWISLLKPKLVNEYKGRMEIEGWTPLGQRIFPNSAGSNVIGGVWYITTRPARLPVVIENTYPLSATG